MSDTVISVENVSKLYRLGEIGTGTLSHDFNRWWHKVRGKEDPYLKIGQNNDRATKAVSDYTWVLKDIGFEVKQGEVLGIIGRNGAGKSTLLKILSRVTTPTSGEIKIKGRIASLLEVGTGFNPELTGRDNIYLNGAILGMKKREIARKFDEIVGFSGVERYVDTPVKRYSSGMYVRLAFAVAAHLEAEILIVDEVLAVGDSEFQQKCLGKLENAGRSGRTVLFVSHNMAAVTGLTRRVLFLNQGLLEFHGPTGEGVARYMKSNDSGNGQYSSLKTSSDKPFVSLVKVNSGEPESHHISGQEMQILFEIRHEKLPVSACFSFQIINQYQQPVIHCMIYNVETPICRSGASSKLICRLPRLALNVGRYTLTTYLSEPPGGEMYEVLENICSFEVEIIDKQTLFGWRPNVCAYIEKFEWSVL